MKNEEILKKKKVFLNCGYNKYILSVTLSDDLSYIDF